LGAIPADLGSSVGLVPNDQPFTESLPERLDSVVVAFSRGRVELPWSSRDAVLAEIRDLDSTKRIVERFETVGVSVTVTLERDDVALLAEAIDMWSRNVTWQGLPEGVWDLRCALYDDLHDRSSET
jgi:hypothetical protein